MEPNNWKTGYLGLTFKNYGILKAINNACLPVKYSDDFYLLLAQGGNRWGKIGLFN